MQQKEVGLSISLAPMSLRLPTHAMEHRPVIGQLTEDRKDALLRAGRPWSWRAWNHPCHGGILTRTERCLSWQRLRGVDRVRVHDLRRTHSAAVTSVDSRSLAR